MMKRLSALLILGALVLSAVSASADGVKLRTIPLQIRTSLAAQTSGYVDSVTATLGLKATIDTTTSFSLDGIYFNSDSLTNIFVTIEGAQNFASGESLYVAIEGSGGGSTFSSVNIATCGTCRSGGFGAAGSIVPGTSAKGGFLRFNGKASSTSGIVASASGVLGQSNLYGGFWAWPVLRLKILSTIATDNVTQPYRVYVSYWQQTN